MPVSINDPDDSGLGAQISPSGALHISRREPLGTLGGRYRAVTESGILTAITAVTSSAGHLLAFRNPSGSGKIVKIERLQLEFAPTVLPSTAQECGFKFMATTAHSVQPAAGGAAVTLTTPQLKKKTSYPVPTSQIYYANSTTVLTTGTYTQKTQPLGGTAMFLIIEGAAVVKPVITLDVDLRDDPQELAEDEGILLVNSILMANNLAGRLTTTIDWAEVV